MRFCGLLQRIQLSPWKPPTDKRDFSIFCQQNDEQTAHFISTLRFGYSAAEKHGMTEQDINNVLKEDKCSFANFCTRNGFSDVRPIVYAIRSNQKSGYIQDTPLSLVKFPAIFKPAIGAGSMGIQMLHNVSDWEKVINDNSDKRFVIEEYVDAPKEYTTHFVVHNGHIVYHKTMSCRAESDGVNGDCFVRKGRIPQDIAEYTIVSEGHLRIFEEIFTKGKQIHRDGVRGLQNN